MDDCHLTSLSGEFCTSRSGTDRGPQYHPACHGITGRDIQLSSQAQPLRQLPCRSAEYHEAVEVHLRPRIVELPESIGEVHLEARLEAVVAGAAIGPQPAG